MKKITLNLLAFCFLVSACSYKLGFSERQMPEGYKEVAIPLFKNITPETGIEVYFTNALLEQFSLSRVAKIVDKDLAPAVLEGVVESVKYVPEALAEGSSDPSVKSPLPNLPSGAVLATKYRVYVTARVQLRRKSDGKILWQSKFENEKDYSAPQLESADINSANALYNHSARHRVIGEIAHNMMIDVHDRLSESF